MVTRKKTARRGRTTTRTGRTRTAGTGRAARQLNGEGPNLTRLLRADVLTRRCADRLSALNVNAIERLSAREVETLISLRRRLGRKVNCWLI
jgi:hypothetical protein